MAPVYRTFRSIMHNFRTFQLLRKFYICTYESVLRNYNDLGKLDTWFQDFFSLESKLKRTMSFVLGKCTSNNGIQNCLYFQINEHLVHASNQFILTRP